MLRNNKKFEVKQMETIFALKSVIFERKMAKITSNHANKQVSSQN